MTVYRRTQFGTANVVALVAAIGLVVVIGGRVGWHPVSVAVPGVLAIVLLLFCALTVDIDRRRLRCSFGPGLIRKDFPLAEIVAARPVRNQWYWGWGIRLTPSGWMFNVSGLDAVELELVQGRRFRVGTGEPDALARAITQAKESA